MSGKRYTEKEVILQKLGRYLPEGAPEVVVSWLGKYGVYLKVTRDRKSKLGDFRPGRGGKTHRISVNGSLNPYSFFMTFVHELAHLIIWNAHGAKALAHGSEWKREYSSLLAGILGFFPQELQPAIRSHMESPGASSCSDPALLMALSVFDPLDGQTFLSNVPDGSLFRLGPGRVMQKGPLRRTRYRCQDRQNKRYYLVSKVARVSVVEDEG